VVLQLGYSNNVILNEKVMTKGKTPDFDRDMPWHIDFEFQRPQGKKKKCIVVSTSR
jgi:hypothetical protein